MMTRRDVIRSAAAGIGVAATRGLPGVETTARPPYRAAVIGHTGRGNYGHQMDVVWLAVPEAKLVAVADGDAGGLAAAKKRLGVEKGYSDYRQMLREERPQLIGIATRHLDQHRDMALAAVEAGVRGIFMEKPMCRTPAEADEIVAACEKSGTKLTLAFTTRFCPRVAAAKRMIEEGRIGKVVEFRARGKEDHRGGGEDMWVLGAHMFNIMHYLGGAPQWCLGRVLKDGRPVTKADVVEGNEGIGLLAGDEVHAMYGLASGVTAYFDSIKNGQTNKDSRYGLTIYGTKGMIRIYNGYLGEAKVMEDSTWMGGQWKKISGDAPEPKAGGQLAANIVAVKEMIEAVEKGTALRADMYEGRVAVEMTAAVFESHRVGGVVGMPMKERGNPVGKM